MPRETGTKTKGASIIFSKLISWKESNIIQDEEGRLLIVKGYINEQKVTLVNLYLPNEGQVSSLEKYLNIIHQNKEGIVILGGDMNMAFDPILDTSKSTSHIAYSKLSKAKKLLQELQVVDSWRTTHT